MPKCSVIIPTYNRRKLVRRAIECVFGQTHNDFEVVVVDDGSTDGTAQVINEIQDTRLVYIALESNQGQNAARNRGIEVSKGEFVAFLDSDDEWLPTMIDKQLATFQRNPNIGCSYTWIGTKSMEGEVLPLEEYHLEGAIHKEALEQGYISPMITLMVKRECLEKVGNFDSSFNVCDDDDLCFRLAKHYEFGLVKQVLAIINEHAGERVTGSSAAYAQGWWQLHHKHADDTLSLCGPRTLAKHYRRCGSLFARAGAGGQAKLAYREAEYLDPNLMGAVLSTGASIPGLCPTYSLFRRWLRTLKYSLRRRARTTR